MASCQQALSGLGGQCVVNPQALPQPVVIQQPLPATRRGFDPGKSIQYPNLADSFQQGQLQTAEMARRREEIRLLKAQRAAIEAQTQVPRHVTNSGYWVMYRCPDSAGAMQYTGVPAPGCIVESVNPY